MATVKVSNGNGKVDGKGNGKSNGKGYCYGK